jgi:predicted DNA-binding transcriptional regulator YafY
LEPLALKEFKNRWYIIGKDLSQKTTDSQVKTFGLDRMSSLEITKVKFSCPATFDAEEQFKHCFGIIGSNGEEPHEVVLSFGPVQGKYIKSMPLHESQQVIVDNDKELRIKLFVYTTYDFKMELLSYGENLKVMEPPSLIGEMKESLRNTLGNY